MKKFSLVLLSIFIAFAFVACLPSDIQDIDIPSLDNLTETGKPIQESPTPSIILNDPTTSPSKTLPPVPSETPTITAIPETGSTTLPEALSLGKSISVYEAPGTSYPSLGETSPTAILDVISQSNSCEWLMVQTDNGINGWIKNDSESIQLNIPCGEIPPGVYRPYSGSIDLSSNLTGSGQLKVENGLAEDGVVLLMVDELPAYEIYIRSGENFSLLGIVNGVYQIYFTSGTDWDGFGFTVNPAYQKFDEALEFTSGGGSYSVWSISLQPVEGGTASTTTINPEDFPDLRK
jgi:hypothetical protein